MSLPVWQATVVRDNGDVVPSAEMTVILESTGLDATIYSDRAGLTPLVAPYFADTDGFFRFFAPPGDYEITAEDSGSGFTRTWTYTSIFSPDSDITTDTGSEPLRDTLNKRASLSEVQWLGTPIGSTVALATHLTGVIEPPTDSDNFRYIKLTAGQDGVGQYNEGVLVSESVTGSAPLVVATAVISFTGSPFDGESVNLWNTEGRYPSPGETSGSIANDQMQRITGQISENTGRFANATGAMSSVDLSPTTLGAANGANNSFGYGFDSANSPDARTGTSTNVKRETRVFYMRIA